MVAVLACLLVISLVGMGMVQSMLDAHRGTRLQHDRAQAQWLAESGLERGAVRLAADANYKGETWTIPANELDGRRGGVVEIAIEAATIETAADEAAEENGASRRLRVSATLGEGPHRVTASIERPLPPQNGDALP